MRHIQLAALVILAISATASATTMTFSNGSGSYTAGGVTATVTIVSPSGGGLYYSSGFLHDGIGIGTSEVNGGLGVSNGTPQVYDSSESMIVTFSQPVSLSNITFAKWDTSDEVTMTYASGTKTFGTSAPASNAFTAVTLSSFTLTAVQSINPPAQTDAYLQSLDFTAVSPSAFRISHSGSGINCAPSPITITAVDNTGTAVTNFNGTIAITTNTAHGTWSMNSGNGSFSAGGADSGQATYTFAAADNGTVILNLSDTHAESVNINIASGTLSEDSNYDPSIVFQPTGLRFLTNGAPAAIPAQIAGRTFSAAAIGNAFSNSIQLEAVGTDPSNNQCTALLTNATQAVNFATECQDPVACVSALSIGGNAIATNNKNNVVNYTPLNLNFVNGRVALSINYIDAGQLKLYANTSITNGGQTKSIAGASNPFIVLPFGFCISPASNTTGNINPNATDANGTIFTSAGSAFSATIKAVAWNASDDSNNDGVADANVDLCSGNNITPNFGLHTVAPTVTLSSALQQPIPGAAGSLTGNTTINSAFTSPNGQTQATLNWDEVGIITLSALSTNYLSSGFNISGTRPNVGRFIPHHFAVANGSTLTNRSDIGACTASTFTYLSEPLSLGFTLQAQNANNGITLNYQSLFSKLQNFSNLNTQAIFSGAPRTALAPTLNGTLSANWVSGVWAVNANVLVNRIATSSVSYPSTAFGVAPQDSDNVGSIGFNLDTSVPGDSVSDHIQIGNTTNLYYGRLRLDSASGPANMNLPIPVTAEFWNGTQFQRNVNDQCTAIAISASNPALNNYQGSLNAGETSASGSGAALISGTSQTALIMSQPGIGNEGSVDLNYDLTSWPWLQFDWDQNGVFDTTAKATASFGTYRGSDRMIYWQEIK